jgi:hypothetical protein
MKATTNHRLKHTPVAAKMIPSCGHTSFWPSHGKHEGKTFATAERKAQTATSGSSTTTLSLKRSRRAGKNTPQPNTEPTQSASVKIRQAKRL